MDILAKKDISTILKTVSPLLHAQVRKYYRATVNACRAVGTFFVRLFKRIFIFIALKLRRLFALPLTIKIYATLLTLLPIFAAWQFFAYQLPQATFITINLIIALILTISVLRVSIFSHNRMDEMQQQNDELMQQLDKRDAELAKLKADIFEYRNKARRDNATKKSALRFVELVKELKKEAQPGDEKYQYIVSALSKTFDVSGIVAYARIAPDSEEFHIAGRYALADNPPTDVVTSGEGILGQAIASNKVITLSQVPKDYLTAVSGLGKSRALNVYALPVTSNAEGTVVAVIEVASFAKLPLATSWDSVQNDLGEII